MVGTFYRAASPEAKAFVMEGDSVRADSTLCIIEGMKVMNEIKAEEARKGAADPGRERRSRQYGQALFLIQLSCAMFRRAS